MTSFNTVEDSKSITNTQHASDPSFIEDAPIKFSPTKSTDPNLPSSTTNTHNYQSKKSALSSSINQSNKIKTRTSSSPSSSSPSSTDTSHPSTSTSYAAAASSLSQSSDAKALASRRLRLARLALKKLREEQERQRQQGEFNVELSKVHATEQLYEKEKVLARELELREKELEIKTKLYELKEREFQEKQRQQLQAQHAIQADDNPLISTSSSFFHSPYFILLLAVILFVVAIILIWMMWMKPSYLATLPTSVSNTSIHPLALNAQQALMKGMTHSSNINLSNGHHSLNSSVYDNNSKDHGRSKQGVVSSITSFFRSKPSQPEHIMILSDISSSQDGSGGGNSTEEEVSLTDIEKEMEREERERERWFNNTSSIRAMNRNDRMLYIILIFTLLCVVVAIEITHAMLSNSYSCYKNCSIACICVCDTSCIKEEYIE